MKNYIGIDLGGTNVRVGKVSEDGEILFQLKGPSFGLEGPQEKIFSNVVKIVKSIPDYMDCVGIGAGVPGPVDTVNGKMNLSTNLVGFQGFMFADALEKEVGLKTFIDNDANVTGLAEALVGSGKGLKTVYYTTLSTGIGGALIVDGKVVSGKNGFAGEIANLIVDRNREKVNYLNVGAIENEASGTAIVRKATKLFNREFDNAGEVFKLSLTDDRAKKLIDDTIYDLAVMYSLIGHIVDPDMFILGGGLMKSKEYFFDRLVETYKGLVHEKMRNIKFKEASLNEPGLIGAAMLPRSRGL